MVEASQPGQSREGRCKDSRLFLTGLEFAPSLFVAVTSLFPSPSTVQFRAVCSKRQVVDGTGVVVGDRYIVVMKAVVVFSFLPAGFLCIVRWQEMVGSCG